MLRSVSGEPARIWRRSVPWRSGQVGDDAWSGWGIERRSSPSMLSGPGHRPRGLATRSGRRFDGRRYAVCCLVMASAEGAGEHTTLQRLFEDVGLRASGIDGLGWDGRMAADRRLFIQAVQALQD